MPTPPPPTRTVHEARRGLALYFALVLIGTAFFQLRLLLAGDGIDQHTGLVLGLMWTPGIASFITRGILREGIRDVSFRWGGRRGTRAAGVAWMFPMLVGGIAYGTAWVSGLDVFSAPPVHFFGTYAGTPAMRFLLRLAVTITIGVPLSAISAAGEEFGWRGYMLTRLIDARVPRPALVSGLIWGLWHTPLILSGQYAAGPYPAVSALVFMASILPAAYLHAYVRLASGSVWPAVVAHATWNAVIQGVFDRCTRGGSATHTTSIWVGESGLLVVAASIAVAAGVLPRVWPVRRDPRTPAGTLEQA